MSEDERYLWLEAAWPEVEFMPATVLSNACAEARRVVDHPAKLIPAIIRFGSERAEKLRADYRHELAAWNNRNARRLTAQVEPEQSDEDRAEVAGMIRDLRRKMAASALRGAA